MILVTGATGFTGRELVRLLLENGVSTRALVRDQRRAREIEVLGGVGLVEGDMIRPETLAPALECVDRAMLISSSAPDTGQAQTTFIDAAARAGVGHIVKLSGIMPALDSPFRFARMHAEIERHLERSGVGFTHLRAGELMHTYFRQVPSILATGALRVPMEEERIASIDVGDIAAAAAAVLTTPGHEGKTCPITGPDSLTMTDVAAAHARDRNHHPLSEHRSRASARGAARRGRTAVHGRRAVRALRRAPARQRGSRLARAPGSATDRTHQLRSVRRAPRRDLPRRTAPATRLTSTGALATRRDW